MSIFGNDTAERTLLALQNYGEGYAREIAEIYGLPHSVVQKQLLRLERDGILVSQLKGRTRVFTWNPRYPLKDELSTMPEKALTLVPESDRARWFYARKRPRRTGKAL
jgi:DNA-binding transcriptional ArsR family regulator